MCTNRLALVLCVHLMLVTIQLVQCVWSQITPTLLLSYFPYSPTLPLSYFPYFPSSRSLTLPVLLATQNLNFLTSVQLLIPLCPLSVHSSPSFLFPPLPTSISPYFSIILPLFPSPSPPPLPSPPLPSLSTGYKTMDHHGILRRRLCIRLGKQLSLHVINN